MTRETKVGLVVAVSFVSLVGVVVWQKMKKGGQDDANPVTIAIAPPPAQPKVEAKPASDQGKSGVLPADLRIQGPAIDPKNDPKDGQRVVQLPDPKLPLPAAKSPDDVMKDLLKEAQKPKNVDPLLPALPPWEQLAMNDPKDGKNPKDQLPKEKTKDPFLPVLEKDPKGVADPKVKDNGLPPPPMWDPKALELPDPKKDPLLPPPPPIAVDPKKDPLLPPPPPVAVDPKKDSLPSITDKKDPLMPPPPPFAKNDAPPLGFKDPIPLVKNPDVNTRVTSMESYTVREADTLQAISQRSYGSEKYASALLAFNRAKNKDALVTAYLLGNTPKLVKGMELMVPPAEYLTTNYGQLIQEPRVADNSVPFSIKPPTAAPDKNPNAAPIAKANTSDPTRRYRVPDQGQYVIDIAAKTLNNASRWNEILRLNPSLRPEFPIPGGTELQLPAN